ncbi:hypothetical protein AURDEDRAFT_57237, partial [Auricularia subglabra TFB-10046 SS5]
GYQKDMLSSITHVKQSCLMTLNNLLSGSHDDWLPIVPPRRHSMPNPLRPESSTQAAQALEDCADQATFSALQTLLSNLRAEDEPGEMQEIASRTDELALISELLQRVESRSGSLQPRDAELARALVSVLSHLTRLSAISVQDPTGDVQPATDLDIPSGSAYGNVYDALRRQVSDFQTLRLDQQRAQPPSARPVLAVETSILWTRIDQGLDSVLRLSRERHDSLTSAASAPRSWSPFPPEYEHPDHDDMDHPPEYKFEDTKHAPRPSMSSATLMSPADEKMRMDLEAVAMAIDRFYLVAPQLHNQRVELKKTKLEQMERARLAGSSTGTGTTTPTASSSKAKRLGKMRDDGDPDPRELDKLLGMIGRASSRKFTDQVVVLDDNMKMRMDKSKESNIAKRDAFVEQLAQHSDARRLHSQDAVLQVPRLKDPHAMLTLPEFIREPIPATVIAQDLDDPMTLLTLPEFVRESQPPPPQEQSTSSKGNEAPLPASRSHMLPAAKSLRRLRTSMTRSRSLSAPPLAWLKASKAAAAATAAPVAPPVPRTGNAGLSVTYIAEYQDTLKTLYAFLRLQGVTPDTNVEAEVIGSGSSNGLERLLLKCGANASRPLRLPVHVVTGMQEVRVQSSHYEINLPVAAERPAPLEAAPLLDAAQIESLAPTAFACTSCSLPLVHANRITRWNDLPSEHWAELLDAWMCHQDQKLTDHAKRAAHGFWPREGQALIGGSYFLFDESSVVGSNLKTDCADEKQGYDDWRLVRCLCGAVIGRSQQSQAVQHSPFEDEPPQTYRLAKYSLRPVGLSTESIKIPLSAYIIQDMHELAQAHAIWRFILVDEEEEKPRLLLWMLKPHMLISYEADKHYLIPRSGSLHVAKILFKLIGPGFPSPDVKTLVEQHPHFAQHERLLYPFHVCQHLAGLLQESNGTYPESMQELLGLRVGWLQRS